MKFYSYYTETIDGVKTDNSLKYKEHFTHIFTQTHFFRIPYFPVYKPGPEYKPALFISRVKSGTKSYISRAPNISLLNEGNFNTIPSGRHNFTSNGNICQFFHVNEAYVPPLKLGTL